jgi:quercetin dioxygenase-like cupin family protein
MTEGTKIAAAAPSSQHRIFADEPMLVREFEATRFLWGDEQAGQVSDLIYGRGRRNSAVTFTLGPRHRFGASETWKPLYDQHRFYYVVRGTLAVQDPETGEVAVASPGEAITWRGSRYHFGYNVGSDEVVVLDWFGPAERAPDQPEITTMPDKRPLGEIRGGRYELLGAWPDRRESTVAGVLDSGGLTTVNTGNALHFIQGARNPLLVSFLTSSEHMTAGQFLLTSGTHSDPEQHPGDEVVFALSGQLNVYLPGAGQWFELRALDCLYLPEGTAHQYWSYGDEATTAVFSVAPSYR